MSDKVVKLPNQPNHLASLPTLHFNSLPARYNKKIGFGNFSKTRPIYIQVQSQTEIEAEAKKEQDLFPVYSSDEFIPKVYKPIEKHEPPCHSLPSQETADDSSTHSTNFKKRLLEGPISTPEVTDIKDKRAEGGYYTVPSAKKPKYQKLTKVRVSD